MKHTMSDIAERLGLSRNAVSAVINGRAEKLGVSKETILRVNQYLDECGYVRSHSAVALKNGTKKASTGLIYCGEFLYFNHLNEALRILSRELAGDDGIFEISGVASEALRSGIAGQLAKGVERLVWIHANPPEVELRNAEKLFPLLEQIEQSVIYNYDFGSAVWDEEYLRRGISLLGFDRLKAYGQIADAFQANGCTHAALYEVPHDFSDSVSIPVQKMAGEFSKRSLEISGLSGGEDRRTFAFDRIMKLVRSGKKTGVFIRDENFAADIAFRLLREGVRIPDEVALASFGNSEFLAYLPVPITSIEIPVKALCASLLELIGAALPENAGRRVILDCAVKWRESLPSK